MIERHVQRALGAAGVWPPTLRIALWLALCAAAALLIYLLGG